MNLTYNGNTLPANITQQLIDFATNELNTAPSFLITKLHYEGLWGGSTIARDNNNWGGMTWNSSWSNPYTRPSGVVVTRGSARPANEGGHYIRYATVNDFIIDWSYLIRRGGIYNVADSASFDDAVKGLFIYGGAQADYATMNVEGSQRRYELYLQGMKARRTSINNANAGALDTIDGGAGGSGGKPAWPTADGLPITSNYGYRGDIGVPGASQYHWAIDIGSGGMADPPIYATQDGVVTGAGIYSNGGVYVIIKHTGDQFWSRYLHLKSYTVSVGQAVQKGDPIGIMGATGIGSGVHLDFAISTNGVWQTEESTIDPEEYLQMSFGGGGSTPPPSKDKGLTAIPVAQKSKFQTEGTLNGMTYYQVKAGDSLSAIAKKHGVNLNDIQRVKYQTITNKNAINKGEVLILPVAAKTQPAATPKTHTVRPGENLSSIAKKYGKTVAGLAKSNGIKNKNVIYVGQVLKV